VTGVHVELFKWVRYYSNINNNKNININSCCCYSYYHHHHYHHHHHHHHYQQYHHINHYYYYYCYYYYYYYYYYGRDILQYAREKQKFVNKLKVCILIRMFDFWCLLRFEYAEKFWSRE